MPVLGCSLPVSPKRVRPIRLNKLGRFLVETRLRRGFREQNHAAEAAARMGYRVTRQILLRLERGQTRDPDVTALRDLARFYEVPYEEVIGRLVEEKYDVELYEGGIKSALPKGKEEPPHDGEADRIRELEGRIVAYKEVIASLGKLASTAHAIAERGLQGRPPARNQSRGRRRNRGDD